jgi:putative flippase GtrA
MSIFVHNKTIAFMIGYSLGLVPSYFLNSTMTFHNRDYKLIAFLKYCVSYIPNFLVQTLCVGILIEILAVNTVIAYITAVLVGVPITFLIVSMFAIKNKEVE